MANKAGATDIPLGLQRLKAVDYVTVRQTSTWFANSFEVTTGTGDLVFDVKEHSAALAGLCGTSREFNMEMYDANQQQVVRLRRPYTFRSSKVEVSMCGAVTSVLRVRHAFRKRVLSINDGVDLPVLRVKQSLAVNGEYEYQLLTLQKERIGYIRKQWSGLSSEECGMHQFLVTFPLNLDVRLKAAVISTCLLINVIYYGYNGPE